RRRRPAPGLRRRPAARPDRARPARRGDRIALRRPAIPVASAAVAEAPESGVARRVPDPLDRTTVYRPDLRLLAVRTAGDPAARTLSPCRLRRTRVGTVSLPQWPARRRSADPHAPAAGRT